MNALPQGECKALELVEIIEFKWLMAGIGHRVHVERLQNDRAYAIECLTLAAAAPGANLRSAAQRLLRQLGAWPLPQEPDPK